MTPSPTSWLLAIAFWIAGAAVSHAQLSTTFGPARAPLGCPIRATIANDLETTVQWDPCGFAVYDAQGQLVYAPSACAPVTLGPGDVHTSTWPQTDLAGNPVPPGQYFLESPSGPAVTVGGVQAAIGPLGSLRRGRTRHLQLSSPQDPGARYLLLASMSRASGFSTCGGTVPLDRDRILFASLANPVVFQRFAGRLDGSGLSVDPALAVPDDPRLSGVQVHFTFLVLDPQAACRVRRISETASFPIL